ncbi:MAG: PAS domain S-box protein, partial [Magnetococcales bacterium]|nr:PAS domain S-box protein [Magnetococcales bacterium]
MKVQNKVILLLLMVTLIPLFLVMGVSLWYTSGQVQQLTLEAEQNYIGKASERLSGYFSARSAEVAAYAHTPTLISMDWQRIRPLLITERARLRSKYEKFILGRPDSRFYNTKVGNPAQGGLASFNDKEPTARLKSIKKRRYWRQLVGENSQGEARSWVSDPMISYTTGVRQVVVGASIIGADHTVVGMLGGGIAWQQIEQRLDLLKEEDLFHRAAQHGNLLLVDRSGTYIYHWDKSRSLHLKMDESGRPLLNEVGEKQIVKRNITEEPIRELAHAGTRMIAGQSGFDVYWDPDSAEEKVIIYAPVKAAGYALALIINKKDVLQRVENLQLIFILAGLAVTLLLLILSFWLGRRISQPITELAQTALALEKGELTPSTMSSVHGTDEISKLFQAFRSMAREIKSRELGLSNQVALRTEELSKEVEKGLLTARELKASEAKTRAVLNTVIDGIITIDERGAVATCNPAAERLFGYAASEVVGKNVKMLMPEPYHSHHDGYLRHYMEGGDAQVIGIGRQVIGQRKDGTLFPMELAVNEMETEGGRMFVGLIRDISERQQAEETLQRSEATVRSIVETAISGILTITPVGRIEMFNPAAEQLFGYRPEEVIGRNINMLMPSPYHEEHDGYLNNYRDSGIRKIIGIGREVVGRRKDGSTFPLDLAVSEMKVGEEQRFVGIITDATPRKEAEEALLEAKNAADAANRSKSDFLANMSHEIRTPLNAVIGLTHLCLQTQLSAQQQDYLTKVHLSANALLQLINDILDFS